MDEIIQGIYAIGKYRPVIVSRDESKLTYD